MPPALSDDESSDGSGIGAVTTPPAAKRGKKGSANTGADSSGDEIFGAQMKKAGRPKAATASSTRKSNGKASEVEEAKDEDGNEDDDNDNDDDDEDMEEDEYEVQSIMGHIVDGKEPRFHVKWKGYDKPQDFTWEPEDNLAENASEILAEYIKKIGGRDKLFEKPTKGKKRGRKSTGSAKASSTPPATSKRARTSLSEEHPLEREEPAEEKQFKLPAGSWEDEVTDVEMFQDKNELRVLLTWKNGKKTQHPAEQAYTRCPQRILRFYESRISFKQA